MAVIRKILVATDFSEQAHAAEDAAVEMARSLGASVTLLHVYQLPTYLFFDGGNFLPPSTVVSQILADVEAGLLQAKTRLAPSGVAVDTITIGGVPYDDIVRYAKEQHYDLIVIGTHGRRGLVRLALGSVAERVVRTAHIPVLTVPRH